MKSNILKIIVYRIKFYEALNWIKIKSGMMIIGMISLITQISKDNSQTDWKFPFSKLFICTLVICLLRCHFWHREKLIDIPFSIVRISVSNNVNCTSWRSTDKKVYFCNLQANIMSLVVVGGVSETHQLLNSLNATNT